MLGAVMLLVFALVGVNIWAIVDVARRPEHQWKAIKQDRTLWLVLTARKQLTRAESRRHLEHVRRALRRR